jgi:hypothetical protein
MRRVLAGLAGAVLLLTTSGCGYKHHGVDEGGGRLGVGTGDEPTPAPQRPDSQPRRSDQGIRGPRRRRSFEAVAKRAFQAARRETRVEQIDRRKEETSALGRLLAIAENYPNLKADAQFARLSDELSGTENRIAVERKRYNDTVQEYNTYVKRLPQALYARFIGSARRSTSRCRRART